MNKIRHERMSNRESKINEKRLVNKLVRHRLRQRHSKKARNSLRVKITDLRLVVKIKIKI